LCNDAAVGRVEVSDAFFLLMIRTTSLELVAIALAIASPSWAQSEQPTLAPPGRLVDIGGYRIHLLCTGTSSESKATVILSAGGGDFATDWSLVQQPLSDSLRVCSYDRAGYGWSEPGPYPRTIRQEAFELRKTLKVAGVRPPYILVGHSIGAFVVRSFAHDYQEDVSGVVLVGPTNENGKLGYRGQWVLPRTLATDRPVPSPRVLSDAPPRMPTGADSVACRAQAARNARIWRPYDQLRAEAQRYRVWALQHPSCVIGQDDFFAEEMAAFFASWQAEVNPLGDVPLVVVMGTLKSPPPPGLSDTELRSDSLRIDLSRLSRRGRLVTDSLSGHHVQLDNPALVLSAIRSIARK
jgi:pimeloyl-ACP methyl ester carboxylesterase